MSTTSFINALIASPGRAQLIHQKGTLIFANTAAAAVFGIANVREFVSFAETSKLFANATPAIGAISRSRSLAFRSLDGEQKKAIVTEHAITWNGYPSAYLTIDQLDDKGEIHSDVWENPLEGNDETYFLDSIDSAMDWSRTEGRNFVTSNKPFDLAGTCLRLADELRELAHKNDVTLNIEVKPKALHTFYGDAAKLVRAASCIIRHVIYRNPGGRVDITLNASNRGDFVSIDVCDNGSAYTSWDAINLLEPNQFPDEERAEHEALDLPLAQCIAQFLGGQVTIKVNHQAGGMIRLRLPFRRIATQPQSQLSQAILPHLKILVAEDNPTSQQVIRIILTALGHQALIVANGRECVEALRTIAFDAVFMDLHMPVMDGYEATGAIRALEEAKCLPHVGSIPILALTADRRPEARAKAELAGISGFLTKPIHIPQILSALTPISEAILEAEMEALEASQAA